GARPEHQGEVDGRGHARMLACELGELLRSVPDRARVSGLVAESLATGDMNSWSSAAFDATLSLRAQLPNDPAPLSVRAEQMSKPVESVGARARVHPGAHVDPAAVLDEEVEIGPGAVVGPEVHLGRGVRVGPNAILAGKLTVGAEARIFPGAVVG